MAPVPNRPRLVACHAVEPWSCPQFSRGKSRGLHGLEDPNWGLLPGPSLTRQSSESPYTTHVVRGEVSGDLAPDPAISPRLPGMGDGDEGAYTPGESSLVCSRQRTFSWALFTARPL